jgi:putative membrane protein
MKNKIFILLALLVSAVSISSCHKDSPVVYSLSSQDFVAHAASNFNFQIQAGNLAMSKGLNDSVKSYGTVMVSDNTAAYAALKTLATTKGLTVSTTLQATDQSNLNSLSTQSGAAFDQAYAQMMVLTHNQEGAFFNLGSQYNGVADADLRSFAFNQLPLLSVRLQQAYSLQTLVAAKQ